MNPKSAPIDPKKLVAKKKAQAKKEHYELMFDQHCRAVGIPPGEKEHRFHPTRDWRFDRAWPAQKVAFEIDGGVYTQGRHTRGKGYEDDCIKYAEAGLLGWRVFRFSTGQVKKGIAIQFAERLGLKQRNERIKELMKL